MPVLQWDLKVESRFDIAQGSFAVAFKKPADFTYIAGQHLSFRFPDIIDDRAGVRPISMASSPTERTIMIAVRKSLSGFKEKLAVLAQGERVHVLGPLGHFTFVPETKTHVMIAGGIGITPFRSMIKDVLDRKLSDTITLLYSNRRPEHIAFKNEFDEWSKANPALNVVYTATDGDIPASWTGKRSLINADFIKKFVPDLVAPTYYVVGPPPMVDALEYTLGSELGIAPEKVKLERFTGY